MITENEPRKYLHRQLRRKLNSHLLPPKAELRDVISIWFYLDTWHERREKRSQIIFKWVSRNPRSPSIITKQSSLTALYFIHHAVRRFACHQTNAQLFSGHRFHHLFPFHTAMYSPCTWQSFLASSLPPFEDSLGQIGDCKHVVHIDCGLWDLSRDLSKGCAQELTVLSVTIAVDISEQFSRNYFPRLAWLDAHYPQTYPSEKSSALRYLVAREYAAENVPKGKYLRSCFEKLDFQKGNKLSAKSVRCLKNESFCSL